MHVNSALGFLRSSVDAISDTDKDMTLRSCLGCLHFYIFSVVLTLLVSDKNKMYELNVHFYSQWHKQLKQTFGK